MNSTKKQKSHVKRELSPASLLNPVPVVLVSCRGSQADSKPNVITVAWTGTICSDPPMVSVSIRPIRHSYSLIKDSKEFVINLVNQDMLKACDYCGVKSGKEEDKLKASGLSYTKIKTMKYAPAVLEAPLSIACSVEKITKIGSHDVFAGRITHITCDENYIDKNDKIRLEDAGLVCYSHGDYYALGKKLGFFGFSVASPKAYTRRMRPSVKGGKKA